MRVILLASAVWAATKDAEVTEKVRTASMMARKSRVYIVICYGGGVEVLRQGTFAGAVVLGAEGFGGAEDVEAMGNGAGTEDTGNGGSSVCTTGGGCSSIGKSDASWSSASF